MIDTRNSTGRGGVLFSAVLRPNRSATIRGLNTVMALMAVIWLGAGAVFAAIGAWPVFGFLGLDVLVLYLALRFSMRAGQTVETIDLTERALTVRRINHWGRSRDWSFSPHWLQVVVDDLSAHRDRLELRSRGHALVVGSFLTPAERAELAGALRGALRSLSAPVSV